MNDIYTWHNDLYPLVKKRFDMRYAKRLDVIDRVTDVVCRDDIDYRLEGVGGYGELPLYDGTTVPSADSKRTFITTITPKEHALRVTVSYKKAKLDYSGEAAKIGTRLADSAYMTVLNEFYRLFGGAFDENRKGADGVPWASTSHPVSRDGEGGTFSNLMKTNLSVSAITEAQSRASRFVTRTDSRFPAILTFFWSARNWNPKRVRSAVRTPSSARPPIRTPTRRSMRQIPFTA